MKKIFKTVFIMAALSACIPTATACTAEYLTYHHTPGEKTDQPETPDEPEAPETMDKGTYRLLADSPAQIIKGLGFEIQADMNAAADVNNDNGPVGVPMDLVPAERKRLAEEMLKGFRYMRVGMGIWFRGVTPDKKNIVERREGQAEALVQLMKDAAL